MQDLRSAWLADEAFGVSAQKDFCGLEAVRAGWPQQFCRANAVLLGTRILQPPPLHLSATYVL